MHHRAVVTRTPNSKDLQQLILGSNHGYTIIETRERVISEQETCIYTIIHVLGRQTDNNDTYTRDRHTRDETHAKETCRQSTIVEFVRCIHLYYTAPSSRKKSSSIHNNLVVVVYVEGSGYFELE